MSLRETIGSVFSFLGTRSKSEEMIATYLIREHGRGRDVAQILEDPYIRNRCTPQQIDRLLDRPEVIHALGESTIAATRSTRAGV
ncbi:MAG TPA: hypothetical protein VHC45_01170 [Gaiellaceae bacterium]|jgi:hypothetical protein|nr:hypothetical protein [Gaiellaceae bacterium]